MKRPVYSYSKLTKFNKCQYSYYQTYILKRGRGETVYTFLGGKCHEILELLQQCKIDNKQALDMFYDSVEESDLLGLYFPTENSRTSYIQSINHFFTHYKRIDAKTELEKEFLIDLDGILVKGFIDLIVFEDESIVNVFDYKTSTKFATKDLPHYGRQLVLYAYAVQQLNPEVSINRIGWDMLKYALIQGKRKIKPEIRANIDQDQWCEPYILEYEYSEQTVNELLDYIKATVKEIESKQQEQDFTPCDLDKNSYNCRMSCEHYSYCSHYLNHVKNVKK